MGYILSLETATKNCSVALSKNGETLFYKELATLGYSHAEQLHVFIEALLHEAHITFSDLVAIAVGQGPGSYTGLRIGVSAAKGLCYALNIPLIALDTLQVLAKQVAVSNGLIVPMIDARRMEVFSAVFDCNHQLIRSIQAEIITEHSFEQYSQTLYFVGDCLAKCQTVLSDNRLVFLEQYQYPSAKDMAYLAYEKFQKGAFEDVAYFEPFYLKDFMMTTSKK